MFSKEADASALPPNGDNSSYGEPFYTQVTNERQSTQLFTAVEGDKEDFANTDRDVGKMPVMEVGLTKESLSRADEAERSRSITRMIVMVRGVAREEPTHSRINSPSRTVGRQRFRENGAHRVVVMSEQGFMIGGVDARDRPGLLPDLSKGLLQLNLTLRNSEASFIDTRSTSIWRCMVIEAELPDLEEI